VHRQGADQPGRCVRSVSPPRHALRADGARAVCCGARTVEYSSEHSAHPLHRLLVVRPLCCGVYSSCTRTALQSAAVRAAPLPHASQVRMTTCEPACAAEIKAGLAQTGCCYTQARNPSAPKGTRAAVH
jgi:hypothetical protein